MQDPGSELRRIHLPRTQLRVSLPCSKRRGFKKAVEHLFLQMEPLFALCLCGVAQPSRGDRSPLGWILVPLVGCISLEIS
jgi:hypothetical protein